MSETSIRLTGPWDDVIGSLDPSAWTRTLRKNVVKAHKLVGRAWQTAARRSIRAGEYAPNSPITVILKGSSTPLVADGDLFAALAFQVASGGGGATTTLRLGLVRGRRGANDERINIGLILHEGATLNVDEHSAARRKVWSMVSHRIQSEVTGTSSSSGASREAILKAAGVLSQPGGSRSVWVTPARPFITRPAQDGAVQNLARKAYTKAVEAALRSHFPPSES